MDKTINELLREQGIETRPGENGCKALYRGDELLGHFTANTVVERVIWPQWAERCEAALAELGWSPVIDGISRGLDGDEREDGYSIDSAEAACRRGVTVAAYIERAKAIRTAPIFLTGV